MINNLKRFSNLVDEFISQNKINIIKEIYVDVGKLYYNVVEVTLVPIESAYHLEVDKVLHQISLLFNHIKDKEIKVILDVGDSPAATVQYIDLYNTDGHLLLLNKLNYIKEGFKEHVTNFDIKIDLKNLDEVSPFNLIVYKNGCVDSFDCLSKLSSFIRRDKTLDLANVLSEYPSPHEGGWISI